MSDNDCELRVRFAEIAGVETRWYEAGAGHPVVLLHGVRMTADFWIATVKDLSRDYHIIAPDLLGCGFTRGMTREGQSPYRELLDHLLQFLEHLKIDRLTLVGSSMGGALTAHAYFENPDRYRDLVFVGCETLLAGTPELTATVSAGSRANGTAVFNDPSLGNIARGMSNITADVSRVPESLLLLQMNSSARPGAAEAYRRRSAGRDNAGVSTNQLFADRVGEITVPVLGLWGEKDPRGNAACAARVAELLPTGEYHTIPDVGHVPYVEKPELFNYILRDFLLRNNQIGIS